MGKAQNARRQADRPATGPLEPGNLTAIGSSPAADTSLEVRFNEEANIGKRKKEQQDAHGHLALEADPATGRPACFLFVIADGVSMGQAGALASQTAVEVMLIYFRQQIEAGMTDLSQVFEAAFAAANREVTQLAQSRPGMATTCAATLITGQLLITAHVGDSRIYLARSQQNLLQVTTDHSWVVEMGEWLVQQGHLSRQDLAKDPRRHTITRAFGIADEIEADINAIPLEAGDLLVLCTDGLWDLLPPGMLDESSRAENTDLQALSNKLVEAAMNAGGRDNITLTLARIEQLGPPVLLPALQPMLDRTAADLKERSVFPEASPQAASEPSQLTPRRGVQVTGSIDLPGEDVPSNDLTNSTESGFIEDLPSLKFNPEMLMNTAQKNFALGNWDEAIDNYIELETMQASYHGLYEGFANALIRYIGVAIGEGRIDQAEQLYKRLEKYHINRYNELLADYCIEESRRAAKVRHYPAARAYALFCLRLRPNDSRARVQSELSDMYLAMQRPASPLAGRLAIAQKIYARDEDFGGIRDDLARIYLELGDDALENQVWEEAGNWFSMVGPLRPEDSTILSAALTRQRLLEDSTKARQEAKKSAQLDEDATGANSPALPVVGNAALMKATERERAINEGRPEQELVNRLKDRVSRTQKAWDSGRKEVGAEYIYLVDQLNELLSPNPWQMTFPRVCYDYAKWLLEQKQYEEARPYFQKAQQLGMTAAQQRISEIDRIIRERSLGGRSAPSSDAPDNKRSGLGGLGQNGTRPDNVSHMASVFATRRPPLTDRLIQPAPEQLSGDASTKPEITDDIFQTPRLDLPPASSETEPPDLPPRAAATIASGNWNSSSVQDAVPFNLPKSASENPVMASGTMPPATPRLSSNPLHQAANREGSRLAGTGRPASLNPRRLNRYQWEAIGNLVKGLLFIGLIAGVVIGAVLFMLLVIVPNVGKQSATDTTATASAVETNTVTPPTPTAIPTEGVQGLVLIEGAKPETLRLFLATQGDPTSPYREFNQEGNVFRLPTTTLNRLDPRQKYVIVARPKDSAERQYAENLPPENPAQQPFTRSEVAYDPVKGFEVTLRFQPESLAFYPLKGGEADQELPGGGRYFGVFRHSVRGEFLKFYNANGGLGRFGFPLSEEFDWASNGRVQFFERGWLVADNSGKTVSVGKVGKALMDSTCSNVPRMPPSATPVAVPTIKPDADFTAAATTFKLGPPQTLAFEVPGGPNRLKVQYFEQGRLELNPTDKKATPGLGLLGAEYARCIGWIK